MKRWTTEEDDILFKNYENGSANEIMTLIPNRTWNAISSRCLQKLNLRRGCEKWTRKEDEIIKRKYELADKKEIMEKLPNRTWIAIKSRAVGHLKLFRDTSCVLESWSKKEKEILCKNYSGGGSKKIKRILSQKTSGSIKHMVKKLHLSRNKENCDMNSLLTYTPEAFYWLGFLLADGHFYKRTGYFVLARKDDESVRKLAKFIKCNDVKKITKKNYDGKYRKYTSMSFYSKNGVLEFCNRFFIKTNKTYNPPDISLTEYNSELIVSMLIGLIDGDGSILNTGSKKTANASVCAHHSWENFYKNMVLFLKKNYITYGVSPRCRTYIQKTICDRKVVVFCIGDHGFVKFLKKEAIRMGLPIMGRKWDRVNLNYVAERELTPIVMAKVIELINKGMNQKEIMKETGYTESRVKWAIKKHSLTLS